MFEGAYGQRFVRLQSDSPRPDEEPVFALFDFGSAEVTMRRPHCLGVYSRPDLADMCLQIRALLQLSLNRHPLEQPQPQEAAQEEPQEQE